MFEWFDSEYDVDIFNIWWLFFMVIYVCLVVKLVILFINWCLCLFLYCLKYIIWIRSYLFEIKEVFFFYFFVVLWLLLVMCFILKFVVNDFYIRKSYFFFIVVGYIRDVNNMLCMFLVIFGLFGVNYSVFFVLRLLLIFWCNVY